MFEGTHADALAALAERNNVPTAAEEAASPCTGEGDYTATERLTITAGLRADRLPGEAVLTGDPRVGLVYRTGVWTARLGGAPSTSPCR